MVEASRDDGPKGVATEPAGAGAVDLDDRAVEAAGGVEVGGDERGAILLRGFLPDLNRLGGKHPVAEGATMTSR